MRRLAAWVHVADETGENHVFGPDDVVPAWAAEKITNSKAWVADAVDVFDAEQTPRESQPTAATVAVASVTPSEGLERPPTSGAGSGTEFWVAYAASLGIDVPDSATRGDVITLVDVFDAEQTK